MRNLLGLMAFGVVMAAPMAVSAQNNVSWQCHVYCGNLHPWDAGARAVCQHRCYYAGGPGNMDDSIGG